MIDYVKRDAGDTTLALYAWPAMANGDTGAPVPYSKFADRSVQVSGTFGVGGAVTIEGTNDGTNWATLTDLRGTPLVITAASIVMVAEITLQIRARVTAGDGTTSLDVVLMAKGTS